MQYFIFNADNIITINNSQKIQIVTVYITDYRGLTSLYIAVTSNGSIIAEIGVPTYKMSFKPTCSKSKNLVLETTQLGFAVNMSEFENQLILATEANTMISSECETTYAFG